MSIHNRITGILKSGDSYSSNIVKLIPDMLDHIAEHGDVSSTLTRLLNGTVSKKDSERVRDIVGAVVTAGLTIKFDKTTNKWGCVLRAKKSGGMVVSDNAYKVLRNLGEEMNVKLHSPTIDANLFEAKPKESAAWDYDKSMLRLAEKAKKEGVDPTHAVAQALFDLRKVFGDEVSQFLKARFANAASDSAKDVTPDDDAAAGNESLVELPTPGAQVVNG